MKITAKHCKVFSSYSSRCLGCAAFPHLKIKLDFLEFFLKGSAGAATLEMKWRVVVGRPAVS